MDPDDPTVLPTRFSFAFESSYQRAGRPFGVVPHRAWVDVGATDLDAHFGPWRLSTPLSNIVGLEVTGPYRFFKTAGSARLGVTDLGITFATNHRRGVRLEFQDKVPAIDPFGLLRHPELTVTVAEVDAFLALMRERTGLQ